MSANSKIEWTDHTFNPWIGCTKVSPGCAHCYAESETFPRVQRAGGRELWGKGKERHRTAPANWRQPLKWNSEWGHALGKSLGRKKDARRTRVFCASMCDWLDDEVPIEWLADLLVRIHETPNLDWQLLTKRPENFFVRVLHAGLLLMGYRDGQRGNGPSAFAEAPEATIESILGWSRGETFPANVWVGASVEDQKRADDRIPELLKIPAAIRFLSCEPLLGPVDLTRVAPHFLDGDRSNPGYINSFSATAYHPLTCTVEPPASSPDGVAWVIIGGESGPKARPCKVEWIVDLMGQCRAAGVAVFVKQLGAQPFWIEERATLITDKKGGDWNEWPPEVRVREFPVSAKPIEAEELRA